MHVDVPRNPRPTRLAQIQPEVHPRRPVHRPQHPLHSLRQLHHLRRIVTRKRRQRIKMGKWNDQNVPCGIRKSIQAKKARSTTYQQMRCPLRLIDRHPSSDRMIHRCNHVAKHAAIAALVRSWPSAEGLRHTRPGRFLRAADVPIAPRCPETFHSPEYRRTPSALRLRESHWMLFMRRHREKPAYSPPS